MEQSQLLHRVSTRFQGPQDVEMTARLPAVQSPQVLSLEPRVPTSKEAAKSHFSSQIAVNTDRSLSDRRQMLNLRNKDFEATVTCMGRRKVESEHGDSAE
jgi:hypothetical protein